MGGQSCGSPSSSSRFVKLKLSSSLLGPPHHLQGKRLDSTPVMALNNNLGLPPTMQPAVPAGRKTRKTLKKHPDRPLLWPCRFFSLPPSTASAPLSQALPLLPLLLVGTVYLSFQPLFFSSPERTSFRASGALFVRRDAFCSGMTLPAPSFCPYIITLLLHSLATIS